MDLKTLQATPPWDWPRDAGKRFQEILIDHRADESDRLVAAELAGDLVVINDELADSLTAIVGSPDEPEPLRARAAIALGPVLQQAETDGFEDPGDVRITQRMFRYVQGSLRKLYFRQQHSQGSPEANPGGIGARSRDLAPKRDQGCVFQRRQRLEADGCVFDALGSRF
jgi:hypothetical protein